MSKLRSVGSGDTQKEVSKKLAVHFAQDGFLQHSDKLVRALTAVCLAEMFRIFVGTGDDEMASQGIPAQIGPLSDLNLLKANIQPTVHTQSRQLNLMLFNHFVGCILVLR